MNLLQSIEQAKERLTSVSLKTSLERNALLSEKFQANVFLKREDLQVVRSYKIRGAYNTIAQLPKNAPKIVCASAGNHAQGVAYSCALLEVSGIIFMPVTTPTQKVNQVRSFGGNFVDIQLTGDTFDDASVAARQHCHEINGAFIHPFDDPNIIAGQGTVGLEILEQCENNIDYLLLPVGGGGLAAGVSTVFKQLSPNTKIIGVEPQGAPSMSTSINNGENTALDKIDKFVDGAAVKRVGDLNFELCQVQLDDMRCIPEGKVCSTIIQLHNELGMVVEPAGALTVAALDGFDDETLKGKTVVCVVSGGNNDALRMEEIRERSLIYEGLKHYFMIEFPQRPGTLKNFVSNVLGASDDITYFQFSKKNQREAGPAIVGIEVPSDEHFVQLKKRLNEEKYRFEYLNDNQLLFSQLIG